MNFIDDYKDEIFKMIEDYLSTEEHIEDKAYFLNIIKTVISKFKG